MPSHKSPDEKIKKENPEHKDRSSEQLDSDGSFRLIPVGKPSAEPIPHADSSQHYANYPRPGEEGVPEVFGNNPASGQFDNHDSHTGEEHNEMGKVFFHPSHSNFPFFGIAVFNDFECRSNLKVGQDEPKDA